jgi:DNA polymerase-3 subunit epsilon
LRVHGITTEFLRDKPKFELVVDELLRYVQDAEIIIHNASFDIGFLNKELELAARQPFREHVAGVVDTLVMAKEMFPGKRNNLNALCDRLEVDNRAAPFTVLLLDAELLADVYINLTRGQDALLMDQGDDESISGPTIVQIDLSVSCCRFWRQRTGTAAHEDVS